MVRSVLLLAIAGLATADQTLRAMSGLKAVGKISNLGVTLSAAAACGLAEQECDGGCIPIGAECCGTGDGGYCAVGDYCDNGGCCELGSICTGEPTGCGDDQEACGDRCMPEGAVCCSGLGYCDAGEICDSGSCLAGGGDSSGGDDDDDSSSGGDGGDSSGQVCDSSQEECGDGCMPLGSVCCSNSQYCPANYACAADDRCTPVLSGGGDDDDDNSDDDDSDDFSIPPIPSFTALPPPTYTLAPVPTITGPFSGDDGSDGGDSSSSSDNDNNSGNDNDGESQGSDTDPSGARMVLPSLLASLMVLVPLLM